MLKRIIALTLVCCVLLSGTYVFAAENALNTYYLNDGYVYITRSSSGVSITVYTEASEFIANIYHDVSIFVNGVKYNAGSGRYSKTNSGSLKTTISVPASSGDYIDVYADHYTSHNNITEVKHSNVNYTY